MRNSKKVKDRRNGRGDIKERWREKEKERIRELGRKREKERERERDEVGGVCKWERMGERERL